MVKGSPGNLTQTYNDLHLRIRNANNEKVAKKSLSDLFSENEKLIKKDATP
jgi:hypothetical protein